MNAQIHKDNRTVKKRKGEKERKKERKKERGLGQQSFATIPMSTSQLTYLDCHHAGGEHPN